MLYSIVSRNDKMQKQKRSQALRGIQFQKAEICGVHLLELTTFFSLVILRFEFLEPYPEIVILY